jgi:hypothetical protein
MQCSRLPPCAFALLADRFPIPLQRPPHWFPILGRRFHDYFLSLLLEQPCRQRAQLFGVATKHPPLKLELAFDFDVGHNHGQHLFMHIDSRWDIVPPAGSGERTALTLTRVAGYRRSLRGRQRRPIIRSNTHAPDQTTEQSRLLQCTVDLAAPGCRYLSSEPFS